MGWKLLGKKKEGNRIWEKREEEGEDGVEMEGNGVEISGEKGNGGTGGEFEGQKEMRDQQQGDTKGAEFWEWGKMEGNGMEIAGKKMRN